MEGKAGEEILMDKETQFITTIQAALNRPKTKPPADLFTTRPSPEEADLLKEIHARGSLERAPFIDVLKQVVPGLNIDLHLKKNIGDAAVGIGTLVQEKKPEWGTQKSVVCWDHPLINQLNLSDLPQLKGIPVHTTVMNGDDPQRRAQIRSEVEASFIGITSADYCVAATATLAMKTRPGHARSVSLVPSIHVAVVKEAQILANLQELYTLLKWDEKEQKEGLTNTLSLVSGPSKTGDIELVMVHGAHGPRELHLFIITD